MVYSIYFEHVIVGKVGQKIKSKTIYAFCAFML